MVTETDDIDLETLQAQMDVSMSFAHDLVTSWIRPTYPAQLGSTRVDATQILEEELRRPPRLGVGASIPTAPPLAHEASKLKRRLRKHGAKSDGVVERGTLSSDDQESKGRPTKRKMKADPFGQERNKKKRNISLQPPAENVCKHPSPSLNIPSSEEPSNYNSFSGKGKQQIVPADQQSLVTAEGQQPATLVPLSVRLPVQATFSPSLTVTTVPSILEPTRETSAPAREERVTAGLSRVLANPVPIHDKAKPLGIPLLNLDGPPVLTDKPGNISEVNTSRKRRKRRKKKKSRLITGTGDNSH